MRILCTSTIKQLMQWRAKIKLLDLLVSQLLFQVPLFFSLLSDLIGRRSFVYADMEDVSWLERRFSTCKVWIQSWKCSGRERWTASVADHRVSSRSVRVLTTLTCKFLFLPRNEIRMSAWSRVAMLHWKALSRIYQTSGSTEHSPSYASARLQSKLDLSTVSGQNQGTKCFSRNNTWFSLSCGFHRLELSLVYSYS